MSNKCPVKRWSLSIDHTTAYRLVQSGETPFNAAGINWAEQVWTKGAYTCYRVGQCAGGTGKLNADGSVRSGAGVAPWKV